MKQFTFRRVNSKSTKKYQVYTIQQKGKRGNIAEIHFYYADKSLRVLKMIGKGIYDDVSEQFTKCKTIDDCFKVMQGWN